MARSTKVSLENRDQCIALGLNIAYYRKWEGMTQEQLAEKSGISRSYLGQIESPNMVKTLLLEALFNIASALGVPVSRLLEFRK